VIADESLAQPPLLNRNSVVSKSLAVHHNQGVLMVPIAWTNYDNSDKIYQMVPLYVFRTKIYHFPTSRLQFGQITDLEPIDSESDPRDPLVSAEVAKMEGYFTD
jgi:hypothetical protein